MNFNKAFNLRKEDRQPQWRIFDAEGQILGRFATKVADALRGKDKPYYTPHTDCGDYVIIINADKVALSGDKLKKKTYDRYTGYMGGYKVLTAEQMLQKHPTKIVELAVKRMLPKNKLNKQIIRKLKIYTGAEHPHKAQEPKPL